MDDISAPEALLRLSISERRIPKDAIAAGRRHTIGLKPDGTVAAVGDNQYGQCDVSSWHGIRLPGN